MNHYITRYFPFGKVGATLKCVHSMSEDVAVHRAKQRRTRNCQAQGTSGCDCECDRGLGHAGFVLCIGLPNDLFFPVC